MILRKLTTADRPQAEIVWRDIFEEAPAFVQYYFDNRFHPEHSFGAFDGDRLLAMAQGRPTEIFVENRIMSAMLVAGVSTLPEYRGRGLMHRLMTLLIEHAKSSGFSCCYLHPVKESLYASLGFRNGTDLLSVHSDPMRAHKPFDLKEGAVWDDLLTVYRKAMQTHNGMQLRDRSEMQTVFADYALDNAETLIAYAENRPVGYIVCCPDGVVYELIALCTPAYESLLDTAAERVGEPIKALAPVDCGLSGERQYSMQYLVFDDAFRIPLKNGFCCLAY